MPKCMDYGKNGHTSLSCFFFKEPRAKYEKTPLSSSFLYKKTHKHDYNFTPKTSLYFINARRSEMIWVPKVEKISL